MGSDAFQSVENVPVAEAWQRLASDKGSVLVDVRTRAEWSFVGVPDLSGLGKEVFLVEWSTFPDGRLNPAFVTQLAEQLSARGVATETELFFICRSGARSRLAAEAMRAAGYSRCFNVAEGFEGPLDATRHRGTTSGWKVQGMPWAQA